MISVTYPDNTVITKEYDARSRLISETDSLGNTVTYCYDNADRLILVIDAKGNATEYEYDTLGRRISDTDSMGYRRTYQYSRTGNLIQEISYSGKVTRYSYDEFDRLQSVSVDDNELERDRVSYSRDAYGRIIEISNEIGEISYTYDEYSRVKSVTDENNTTLSYTYDSYGRKSSVKATTEDGKEYGTTYYEYDKYNRLIKISNSYENYTEYSYNTDGTLAREQSSNGIITLYTYNICGEINSLKTIDANSNIVAEYIYARNAAGDITKIEEKTLRADGTLKEKTTQYEYDKSARLTKEIISNADGSIIFEYTYDSLSNRTSQTVAFTGNITDLLDETGRETVEEGNIAYSYNVCNQLVKEEITYFDNTSKTTIYTYNADGDLLSKESGSENTIYKYNVYGYMSTATKTKSSTDEISGDEKLTQTIEKYGYDSEGVRIWKETDGNRTAYVTDKSLTYSQVRDVCGTIGSEI